MEERPKRGRPRRWDPANVKVVQVKLPNELAAAFVAEASKRAMTVQDLLGTLAAEVTGVPYETTPEVPKTAA